MADEQKYQRLNRMLAGFWLLVLHTHRDRLIAEYRAPAWWRSTAPRRNIAVELQAEPDGGY